MSDEVEKVLGARIKLFSPELYGLFDLEMEVAGFFPPIIGKHILLQECHKKLLQHVHHPCLKHPHQNSLQSPVLQEIKC